MAATADSGRFFQTSQSLDASQRRAEKAKNKDGFPMVFASKLLALISDPSQSNSVFVAESIGHASRVELEVGEAGKPGTVIQSFRGPVAPVTSLAVSLDRRTLYGGSWDKTIWSWNIQNGVPRSRFQGHSDFVKTVLCLQISRQEVLMSGGADGLLIVWNISTGEKLHVLKGHGRGVLSLNVDPYPHIGEQTETEGGFTLFSASSDPHIRRWSINSDVSVVEELDPDRPIHQHETSVNALHFDEDGDLWTASSDGSSKCLSRGLSWQADVELLHGDYVRDVVVDETGGWVATVGRDEEVKVWNKSSGDLCHTYSGHYEEISGCVLLDGQVLVTVSIDCTLRRWSLKPMDIANAQKEAGERQNNSLWSLEHKPEQSTLTVEEERELAELMEDE